MRRKTARNDRNSISAGLRKLIRRLAIPLCALALFLLTMFFLYGLRQARISGNISTASRFNQNFKTEVDLKMYYFVTGSSDVLPLDEVETAEALATTLLASTSNRESRRAVGIVLNLCANLKTCISDIEAAEGYDNRMHQLETNVYVITELIQEYMYTCLYYEAGELASLQEQQRVWLGTALLLSAVVMVAVVALSLRQSFRITRSITRPIDELYGRVEEIGRGDLSVRPPVEAEDSKLRALGEGLEKTVARLNEQMELNRQEQIRLRSMELALVQAQINPHFLYNTLDAIMWLVETGKNEQAVEMVASLSNYFRSFLSNGKDIVSLREEALHVRSYLEIQQMRYQDILQYELQMDPELENCRIPKMTLQPLVENAIYHGIKPRRGGGSVRIASSREGDTACLEVRDTGVGMNAQTLEKLRASLEDEQGGGFGVIASCKRLKLMYGNEAEFRVDSAPEQGTVITIRFPIRNEEEL